MEIISRILTFCLIFLTINLSLTAKTFVVSIGVATYKNISPLVKSERDAQTLTEFYSRANADVVTITGNKATLECIINTLETHFSKADAHDRVIIFFSGHGFNGGLCPYDITKDAKSALLYSDISQILKDCHAKEKFVFIDACNSGGIRVAADKEILTDNDAILFFLSSRASEYSSEHALQANGYFTKYLIRGLRGGADTDGNRIITAKELFDFVNSNVESATKGRQHPVMWGSFDSETVITSFVK